MRRLATQTRGDSVKSNRDYQTIAELGVPMCLQPMKKGKPACLLVRYPAGTAKALVAAFGGYITSSCDLKVRLSVLDDRGTELFNDVLQVESQRYWTRVGRAWLPDRPSKHWDVSLTWQADDDLLVWGLNCANLSLPDRVGLVLQNSTTGMDYLNQSHLAPESYYLAHDQPLQDGTVISNKNLTIGSRPRPNPGKKCSQCQRFLPIDPRLEEYRATAKGKAARRAPHSLILAFHGHSAKRTGYQNECRACKKFEINDHFNPRRTADQLHESSVLTRERKILLRENEAIMEFKERVHKKGLRHFVWTRFGKCCFKCGTPVKLAGFELDHTRPLAYLWPLDQYATCLCAVCNNRKKDSFPVDFYSPNELEALARTVGLDLKTLKARALNEVELQRIRQDIVCFAKSWTPRLFNSIATRVRDIQPKIDLFAELMAASPNLHRNITTVLSLRPSPVGGDDLD